MTHTPASGPAGPVTVPPMSSLSMAIDEAVAVAPVSPPPEPQAANNVARHETVNGRGMVRMLVPPRKKQPRSNTHYPLPRGLCKPAHSGNSSGRRILERFD